MLDIEAFGGLDIFQIDAAKGWLEARDDVDQPVWIALINFEIEDIDASELLEQYRLAFHHGFGRQWSDIPKPKHRRTVGDHRHQIGAIGVARSGGGVFCYHQTRNCHAWRVGERQVGLVGERFGGGDFYLAGARELVIIERRLVE